MAITIRKLNCVDADVENSNASYTDSVASGGTLVLPDITVTDSDGSTYTQPSVEDVVCTLSPDTSLEVNGTPEGTFAAGSTIEVNITDGVNPVTPDDVTVVGDVVTIEVPSGGGLDPAGDFLTAAGITDATIESAIRDLVDDLQTFGLWDKLHAIYPFVGGTATTHKFNLKDPRDKEVAFRISFFGGITHNSNGVTGNGSNGFFKPCYTHESPDYLLNNFACIYSRTNSQSGTDLGQLVLVPFQLNARNTSDLFFSRNSTNTSVSVSNTDSRGFFAMSRDNFSNFRLYNNSVESVMTNNGTGTSSSGFGTQYTGLTLQLSNGSRTDYSNRNLAFVAFGESLSTSEVANMKTTIDTFQTALSRNV